MTTATQYPRLHSLGAVALVLATLLPVLLVNTPPLIDVLGHMGRYELQTRLGELPWLAQFYTFRWQVIGNLGADLLVQVLHPVLGPAGAAKFAVVLVPLLAATAILLLSRQVHGRITPFAIAALALVYGLPFTWGFLNFSLAMALALLAFVLWLRLGPGWRRAALFVPISLAVWLCHTFGWAFLGILCTAESLARGAGTDQPATRRLLGAIRENLPLLAPLAPMLAWRSTAAGVGIDGWFDLAQKAQWLTSVLRLQAQAIDIASAGFLLLLVLVPAACGWVRVDRRIGLAAAIAFGAFLLLPKQIFGSVFADMRLAPYAAMLALLALREREAAGRSRALLMLVCIGFLGARLTLTAFVYREREDALETQLAALDSIPARARVAVLVEVPCQEEWALPWFSHIGSMALVRRHVFVNDQWANSSMNPLRVHFPAAGAYATDDKQLFFPEHCNRSPTLKQALGALPVRAFTHVWVVGVAPSKIPARPDLERSWRRADAAIYRVVAP